MTYGSKTSVKLSRTTKDKLRKKLKDRNSLARKRKLLGTEAPKTMGTSYTNDD